MKYQDIYFYIASDSYDTSVQIEDLLGRKGNTVLTTTNIPEFYAYLKTNIEFTCFVFQISGQTSAIESMIKAVSQKNPNLPIILISFSPILLDKYRYYLRLGVTDVLIWNSDTNAEKFMDDLMQSLNLKWRAHLHTLKENEKIYKATVVTTNHEINQPLTVILNAIGLLNAELNQMMKKKPKIQSHLDFISKSSKRIQLILEKLKKIKTIRMKEYTPGVPMINLEEDQIPERQLKRVKINYKDTILLVEQNLTESGMIKDEIKKMGLETISAKSLKEAEMCINHMINKIQAIMLSATLPVHEVESTIIELNNRIDTIPIIVIKNTDVTKENMKFIDSHTFQILSSPITAKSLHEAITNSVMIIN